MGRLIGDDVRHQRSGPHARARRPVNRTRQPCRARHSAAHTIHARRVHRTVQTATQAGCRGGHSFQERDPERTGRRGRTGVGRAKEQQECREVVHISYGADNGQVRVDLATILNHRAGQVIHGEWRQTNGKRPESPGRGQSPGERSCHLPRERPCRR
jgi:hypothetical protein